MKLKEFLDNEDSFGMNTEAEKIITEISSLFDNMLNKTGGLIDEFKEKMENEELDQNDIEQLKHIKEELKKFISNLDVKKKSIFSFLSF